MDSGILDISVSHSGEFLPKIGTVLILNVSDNGIPAVFIVYLVTISGSINNIKSKANTILDDNMRDGLYLGGLPHRFFTVEAPL